MKRSLQASRTSQFPESGRRQLNTYALAVTATGLRMLPLVQPTEAKIVYSPANKYLTNGSIALDLNHDGVVDFVVEGNFQGRGSFSGSCFVGQQIGIAPIPTRSMGHMFSTLGDAAALP